MNKQYQFWFCVGSQDLYGEECLRNVAGTRQAMVKEINDSGDLPFPWCISPS